MPSPSQYRLSNPGSGLDKGELGAVSAQATTEGQSAGLLAFCLGI